MEHQASPIVPGGGLLELMATRRSVRAYTGEPVTDEQVHALLAAAMSAPSAGNEQPWEFVVIRSRETLVEITKINPYASFAPEAPLAILTCVNKEHEKFADYGVLDVAACTQNLLLAAHGMGLGAVWAGIYPMQDRIDGFRALLGLPQTVIPLGLVLIGHPKHLPGPVNRFRPERIHLETW